MEPPQRRDINELLTNGYFKTSRARSPADLTPTHNSPSFLLAAENAIPRDRSRSRARSREPPRRRGPPPPRPTVEDEHVSLSRESSDTSSLVSHDPPLRGTVDQHPIILEADVSAAEAARLQNVPCPEEKDDNPERRFVFIPKSEPSSQDEGAPRRDKRQNGGKQENIRKESENFIPRPGAERRTSRQDLPSLQTKVPRDIPTQYRRSASSYSANGDSDITPQPGARTPGEYLLSPDLPRGKDYFGAPPQHHRTSSFGRSGASVDKRRSGGSVPVAPRPTTPSEKRNSGNFENPRSRRNSNEKLTRPQELSEEYRRRERHPSTHSSHLSAGGSDRERSGRSSPHSSRRHKSDTESDGDSGSERQRRRRHRPRELKVEDGQRRSVSRSNRSSTDAKRYNTSPLPSPRGSPNRLGRGERERAETFPQRSGSRSPVERPLSPFSPFEESARPSDRLNPVEQPARPRSRQSHSISTPTATTPNNVRPVIVPMPIPVSNVPAPSFPPQSQFDEFRTQNVRSAEPKPYWQPPPFQPPSNSLQKPVGAYRRYSEDVERGSVIPLPSCPRTDYVRGKNDWLTLPQCPHFDICPSCFNSTIAPTEFRDFFVRAPPRSPDTEVLCDFGSSPWYRIAWLLTRKERRRDLNLFYGLAKVASNTPACAGKYQAIRQWHSLVDPKSRTYIRNFNVCYSCVKSIEILLPPVRGLFRPLESKLPMGDPRVCDLRFDSKRFIQYFDVLETTADKAMELEAPPDTRALVSLCKRMSLFPECERDTDLIDQHWNVITQLPEFTVCEECFDEVVWPELEDEKAIPMMFNKKLQMVGKASCQLYSPKMRGIFRTAVDGADYKLLASKVRERRAMELKTKKDLESLRRMARAGDPGAVQEIVRVENEWRKWE